MVDASGPLPEPPLGRRRTGRSITVVQIALLSIALVLAAYVAIQALRPKPAPRPARFSQGSAFSGRGTRGQGMRGMMPSVDRKIVKDFDKNGDKRLDRTERDSARAWLSSQNTGGFGRFGGRGRTANPEPGMRLRPSDVRSYPQARLYDQQTLRTPFLTFSDADWAEELAAFLLGQR